MDRIVLKNAWQLLEKMSDENDRQEFGLYDIYYKISTRIFDYRKEHKLSQRQLAEIINITPSMVSKLESGEYSPTIEQLWRICNKLGWKLKVNIEDK